MPIEVRYIGSYGAYKSFLEQNDIDVRGVVNSKLRRYFSLYNLIDVPKFIFSLFQAILGVMAFKPNVLFSKGGPGSFPVVLAANLLKVPIVIHESDAAPSLNTKMASKYAELIALAFENAKNYFEGKEVLVTGNPIRKYLLSDPISSKQAKGYFGFDPNEPLVLVLGGSQGATRINDLILESLPELLDVTQIFHQTGISKYEDVLERVGELSSGGDWRFRERYKAIDYFQKDIRIALQAADIVISRSGSGVFEIAAFSKPSILIPLSTSANDHQKVNAEVFVSAHAAIMMEETNLSKRSLINTVTELLNDPDRLLEVGLAANSLHIPDAASNLAQILLKYK